MTPKCKILCNIIQKKQESEQEERRQAGRREGDNKHIIGTEPVEMK